MPNFDFRLAGGKALKVLKALPYVGDIITAGSELVAPAYPEPSLKQRAINAAVVGVGGGLASGATGGLDAVPALLPLFMGDTALGRAAPAADPYFRLLNTANRIGKGKPNPQAVADIEKALQEARQLQQRTSDPRNFANMDWRSLGL